jgi:signal transduction histidine kinase
MDARFAMLMSPTAMGFLPAVLLHALIFAYLIQRKYKSPATWLLIGWMTSLLLLLLSQFTARVLYDPIGGYIDWMGSLFFGWVALCFGLGFAYYFPRPAFPRERVVALGVAVVTGIALGVLMIVEAMLTSKPPVYNFEEFWYGLAVEGHPLLPFASFNLFDILHPLGEVWLLGVFLRKTIHFSLLETHPPARAIGWHTAVDALWHPQGQDAQTARALAIGFALVPIAALSSPLEQIALLPAGSFSALYLIAVPTFIVTYLNYSRESSTLMVKLVGITLLTLLVVMGLVTLFVLDDARADQIRVWLDEMPTVKTAVETNDLSMLPVQVQYLAARPASGGVFSSTYRMLFARVGNVDALRLAAEDVHLKQRLEQGQYEVLLENPWMGPLTAEQGQFVMREWGRLTPPEDVRSYRGVYGTAGQQYIRYAFKSRDGATLYEVGYSYPDYRQTLHNSAVPLVGLSLGMTLLILVAFPLFFRVNLVQPLEALFQGMSQVNAGQLDVRVPVKVEDEIGFLSHSFNRMVDSLRTSEANVRALNLTLESQVADRTRELQALFDLSAVANRALNLNALLAESLSLTVTALRSDAGGIDLRDRSAPDDRTPVWHMAAQQGLPTDLLTPLRDWMLAHRQTVLIPDTRQDTRTARAVETVGPASLLAVPLLANEHLVGILGLARVSGAIFNADEIALLTSIGDQIRIAIANNALRQQATVLEERQRIARDLHDSITQSLYGLVTLSEAGRLQRETGNNNALDTTLALVGETTRQVLKEMRLFIFELNPPVLERDGLVGLLHQRLDTVEGRANVTARLITDETTRLPLPIEKTLYLIAQEALNNILRHARASSVTVRLHRLDGCLIMEITDDGRGFDPPTVRHGMGLKNMRKRAEDWGGVLEITSQPGSGTCVLVRLPLGR